LRRIRSLLIAGLVLLGLYLAAWPVPVDPVAWQAPDDRGLTGAFAANEALAGARAISLHAHEGPEDATVGHDGALYATTVSGTILRIDQDTAEVSEFARTGGRPLGIEATADGSLLVANAYSGIQRISPRGEVTELLMRTISPYRVTASSIFRTPPRSSVRKPGAEPTRPACSTSWSTEDTGG
jgi:streptogramin lyase